MNKKYALRRAHAPDVFEAFRQLVMLSGDVPGLAARMGYRTGTLYNKADAGDDTHNQPTLRDVVLSTEITGDLRVVEALARTFGRATFDAGKYANTSDEDLLSLLADMGREVGEFHGALGEALRSRRFSGQAMQRLTAEGLDIVSALMTLLSRLEGFVDGDEGPAASH